MKTGIKATLAFLFLSTAAVAARADDGRHGNQGNEDDQGSSYSSSLPAPNFGWLTLGVVALGYGVYRIRRRSAEKL